MMVALGQTSMVRRLERHRRTRALMLAAVLWAASFLLLAGASLVPRMLLASFLFVITGVYTAAVMAHAAVIDALVVEAAPDAARARYVGVYHLSWAVANASRSGLVHHLALLAAVLALGRPDDPARSCGDGSVDAGTRLRRSAVRLPARAGA